MPHPKTDEDWEAEEDLDALERAGEVRKSPTRLSRAKRRAEKLAEVASKRVDVAVPSKDRDSLSMGFRRL